MGESRSSAEVNILTVFREAAHHSGSVKALLIAKTLLLDAGVQPKEKHFHHKNPTQIKCHHISKNLMKFVRLKL